MVATTGASGIIYTYGGAGTVRIAEEFVLELYAGSPVDDTAWLDGGAAAGNYPGNIDVFQAKNSETTKAAGGMKLVGLRVSTAQANTDTITLSGNATKVQSVMFGSTDRDGTTTVTFPNGVLTFAVAGTAVVGAKIWMIVS
tara:strand:- start:5493 stop:5915 length:423 start_codon:yes stop_codon:yes gene_type:complete